MASSAPSVHRPAGAPSAPPRSLWVDGGGVIVNGMPVPMLQTLVDKDGPLSELDPDSQKQVVGAHKANYNAWAAVKLDPAYGETQYWADLAKGTPLENHKELTAAVLGEKLRESFAVFDDVVGVVRAVRDLPSGNGNKNVVGVVSNHATGWFKEMTERFKLLDTFDEEMWVSCRLRLFVVVPSWLSPGSSPLSSSVGPSLEFALFFLSFFRRFVLSRLRALACFARVGLGSRGVTEADLLLFVRIPMDHR
jgi:hypothetical protein